MRWRQCETYCCIHHKGANVGINWPYPMRRKKMFNAFFNVHMHTSQVHLTVKLSAHSLNSPDHEKPPLVTHAPLLK